jgi:hypothetical protein
LAGDFHPEKAAKCQKSAVLETLKIDRPPAATPLLPELAFHKDANYVHLLTSSAVNWSHP